MTRLSRTALLAAAAGGGLALGSLAGAAALLRRDRAVHTDGTSHEGVLTVLGGADTGVVILDTAARHTVRVRFSRGASTRLMAADVWGVALHVPGAGLQGHDAQLLLASSTTDLDARRRLRRVEHVEDSALTSFLVYDGPHGPLLLALFPGEDAWTLRVGEPGGQWRDVGRLELGAEIPDAGRTNPTHRLPVGLRMPLWQRLLRLPTYAASQALGRAGEQT